MNTAMKQMKETQSLMEKCGVNDPWLKKLIRATGDAVSEFDDYNKLVVKARNL